MKSMVCKVFAGLALVAFLASGAVAQTSDTVTVNVDSVGEITVPATTSLTLSHSGGANYDQASNSAQSISVLHNASAAKHVSVSAVSADAKSSDIDLNVLLADEVTPIALVVDGTPGLGGSFETGFAAGETNKGITWTADASLAGTLYDAAGYAFDVTFTLGD